LALLNSNAAGTCSNAWSFSTDGTVLYFLLIGGKQMTI
jgi:hypothetical protein